ncbi:uncharacterized protein perm1b [Acanthopagrus schlegelii]
MDDLDHSMHIAEYDWTSFYEDSEECGLLQPSLACPDNLSLSDSEDSGKSISVVSTDQRELQRSPAANSDEAAGCCEEEVQIKQSDLTMKAEEDPEGRVKSDVRLDHPEEKRFTTEETNIATTLRTEQLYMQSSDGDAQTESDTSSIHETDPLSGSQTELNVSEQHGADRAVGSVALREEKERWFVTVNDSPARQRARASSVKKKQRKKKASKNNRARRAPPENGFVSEVTKGNDVSEGGRRAGDKTQLNQNAEENPGSVQTGVVSDSTSSVEGGSSDKLVTTERNNCDTFQTSDPSRSDSVESDELEDSAEFLSVHSYDSESYLSAAESVEHLVMGSQQWQSSSSLTNSHLFSLTLNTDAERETQSCPDSLSTECEGYESTDVEPTLTFPSVAQSVNKTPDDVSTCGSDTRGALLCVLSETPGFQNDEINLSASGCSSGGQLGLPPVPDVILTPCPVADGPETYAEATGPTRPVFAISAFWDEMEKLTINDILQLRMGRGTPLSDTEETVTQSDDDFPRNPSSLADTVEYNSFDGGLMDTSDANDSDYFTQPDESKPDRSSCEFSTSDFEEEYWQFLGASRNPSPDPRGKNQQGTCGSPLVARDEEESTCSEGKETPVPPEDFEGESSEDQESGPAWPRPIAKSKSVRNVQALNTEGLSLLGNDEISLFLSGSPSPEENMLLKASDSLGIPTPAPFLSNVDKLAEHTQICYPEVFEDFFTEDRAERDSRCVVVFDPEDISAAPVFDFTLCTFGDETSLCLLRESQRSEDKPIPIFSCSHPTVRELTFPNPDYVFLSVDFKDEGDISPIRMVSRHFFQGSGFGTSAAAPHGFPGWKSLLSIRKIRFHDKGSIWCRGSSAWVFPGEEVTKERADAPVTALAYTPSQLCRELAVQQSLLETMQTTRRDGIFSTLKQSDMCLVCIAFASWVLKSSDPEAADAWKAALLANVSALSAIQYLRQYVKKRNPSRDDP